jgi:hypothetical protein
MGHIIQAVECLRYPIAFWALKSAPLSVQSPHAQCEGCLGERVRAGRNASVDLYTGASDAAGKRRGQFDVSKISQSGRNTFL